jgi:flagellar basal-body rod protein FlgB
LGPAAAARLPPRRTAAPKRQDLAAGRRQRCQIGGSGRFLRSNPQSACLLRRFIGWHTSCYYQSGGVNRMFESIFGIHEQALLLHGQRVGILATNLANADTPNYKARDIDFSAVLSKSDAAPLAMAVTDGAHFMLNDPSTPSADLKYRNPFQASLDGNTVEMPVEQAAFAENNVRYQASLGFINGRISELMLAINGQ